MIFKKIFDFLKFHGPSKSQEPEPYSRTSSIERASRIRLSPLHEVSFSINEGLHPIVSNLSLTGMGFVLDEGDSDFRVGALIDGVLMLSAEKLVVRVEVVHRQDHQVGGRFVGKTQDLELALMRYFKFEMAALEMVQVNPAVLKKESDGNPRWYRGRDNCELYLVEKEGRLVRFSLMFFGNQIDQKIDELSLEQKDRALAPLAIKFVQNIGGLSPELCKEVCEHLK